MWWLLEFFTNLLGVLTTDPNAELPKIVRDSYDKSFGPHHPWIVRKGAQLAMKSCPYKESAFVSLKISNASEL